VKSNAKSYMLCVGVQEFIRRKIMSDINQIKNIIKEELERVRPSKQTILSCLSSLQILTEGIELDPKDEWRYIPDTEFFDLVGGTFKLNPEFFMKHLYHKVRRKLHKDMKKRRDVSFRDSIKEFKEEGYVGKLVEMDKYVFEKFCLYDGEQILLKSGGVIKWGEALFSGVIYVTNNRIISLGGLIALSSSARRKAKMIINFSLQQKCYGYVFPIKNLFKLKKISNGVSYNTELNGRSRRFKIKIAKLPNREEHINKLFEILSQHSKEEVQYS